MRIALIGPGIMPIPPSGWGAVEILIWDTYVALQHLGHTVKIINTPSADQIVNEVEEFKPDFVHIHYDNFIGVYPRIKYPCAITSHFGYLERPNMFGGYANIMNAFQEIQPNVFCLSEGIKNIYRILISIPEEKLFVTPNGVNSQLFRYTDNPKHSDRSLYLAKIDYRKRQHQFQSISSLWYAGNNADPRFDTSKNWLGEWSKDVLHESLTDYSNLVLLSDGEAHPLVCMEALSAGLGLVLSPWAKANLDLDKEFIDIIPEERINDIDYVEKVIIENRQKSLSMRQDIKKYSYEFEWINVLKAHYIPAVEKLVYGN